jgi:hypothetical protein
MHDQLGISSISIGALTEDALYCLFESLGVFDHLKACSINKEWQVLTA